MKRGRLDANTTLRQLDLKVNAHLFQNHFRNRQRLADEWRLRRRERPLAGFHVERSRREGAGGCRATPSSIMRRTTTRKPRVRLAAVLPGVRAASPGSPRASRPLAQFESLVAGGAWARVAAGARGRARGAAHSRVLRARAATYDPPP